MTSFLKRSAFLAVLAGAAALASPPSARAAFTLEISGGGIGTTQTVTDNVILSGDLNPATGQILFNGTQGTFSVVTEIGFSNSTGGTAPAMLTLNNFEISGITGGTIVLTLTDTGFTAPPPSAVLVNTQASFTSAAPLGSSVMNETFINNTLVNQAGQTIGVSAAGTSTTNAFILPTSPYTLTSVYTITLTAGGGIINSTGQSEVQATPEPATLAMAFTALPIFGFVAWRRRRKQV